MAPRAGDTLSIVPVCDDGSESYPMAVVCVQVDTPDDKGCGAVCSFIDAEHQQLQDWGGDLPSELSGIEENVTFSLPKALRIPVTQVGK